MSKFDEIAEYSWHHEFADEMEGATWESGVEPDPMVTTSVRLPRSLLDWLPGQADAQHVRPSTLIRQWIEAPGHRTWRRGSLRSGLPAGRRSLPRQAGLLTRREPRICNFVFSGQLIRSVAARCRSFPSHDTPPAGVGSVTGSEAGRGAAH